MYCPYHNIDHPAEINFDTEHVIPYALGGSNQFTISTCKSSNSAFGSDIDAPFQRVFPVAYERFVRNITSASGNPPSLVFRGKTEINGKTVNIEYEITAGEKKLITDPVVEKTVNGDLTHYDIQAAPAAVAKMIRDIDSKAARQGKRMVDRSGNPVTGAEILGQAGVLQEVPTIDCQWDYGAWAVAAQREFVKIALGTAHFLLGENFSRSDDADRLRDFLSAPEENLDSNPINGNVWPATLDSPLAGLSRVLGDPNNHLVAVLNINDQLVVFISLFGDMNGMIVLSRNPEICSLIAPNNGIIIQVDPVTRSFQRPTLMDLLEVLSHAADAEIGDPPSEVP